MAIRIEKDSIFGYTVLFNDEVILECISEDELKEVSIGEMIEFAKDADLI